MVYLPVNTGVLKAKSTILHWLIHWLYFFRFSGRKPERFLLLPMVLDLFTSYVCAVSRISLYSKNVVFQWEFWTTAFGLPHLRPRPRKTLLNDGMHTLSRQVLLRCSVLWIRNDLSPDLHPDLDPVFYVIPDPSTGIKLGNSVGIRDVYPGSRIRLFSIPDPNCFHPGSASKNLSILTQKMVSKL